jgi:hypothetical protein
VSGSRAPGYPQCLRCGTGAGTIAVGTRCSGKAACKRNRNEPRPEREKMPAAGMCQRHPGGTRSHMCWPCWRRCFPGTRWVRVRRAAANAVPYRLTERVRGRPGAAGYPPGAAGIGYAGGVRRRAGDRRAGCSSSYGLLITRIAPPSTVTVTSSPSTKGLHGGAGSRSKQAVP